MRQLYVWIGAAGVGALMLALYAWTQSDRHSGNERDLQERIAKLEAHQLPPATAQGAVVIAAATQDGSILAKQARRSAAMKQGWDLVNKRTAADAQTAIAIFKEAIKEQPQEAQFYNGLGRANLIASKFRDAIVAWRAGLAIDPKIADMQSGIGRAWWFMGDPHRAKAAWEQSIAIDPKNVEAWSSLAWIYLAMGERQKSIDGFVALLAHQKDNDAWQMGLTMARADNRDPTAIAKFFKLPDLLAFKAPSLADVEPEPTSEPATEPSQGR